MLLASKVDEAVTGGKAGVLERLLLDAVPVETWFSTRIRIPVYRICQETNGGVKHKLKQG